MEDDMILKQPADRRLAGDTKDLPPGPPGAENDDEYSETKKEDKSVVKELSKSRRRSPSGSPPPSKRKSPSRGPPRSPRGRRTPSPRRRFGRNRNDYSPDRRRFNDRGRMRRSPLRNRSRDRIDHRRNGRDRFRGRRESRSRSRSNSPVSRRRWSPKKKPSSPPIPPPGAQYSVAGPGMYPDAYTAYSQYGPPQQAYGPGDFVAAPPQAAFATGYPPPPAWGVPPESYQQPNWVPQQEPMAPPILQQPSGVVVQQTVAVQPPGTQQPPPTIVVEKKNESNPTHDAVAQEAENQRDELKKQRTSYLKKTAALKKELKVLKDQRKDLIGGTGSHSPTTKGFLDENERLQSQIQKKLSTIENVIDMLTGIIGEENLSKEEAIESPKKHSKKKRSTSSSSSDDSSSSNSSSSSSSSSSSESEDNSSPERLKSKAIESMKHKRDVQGKAVTKDKKVKDELKKADEKKINYVFYDPEMHWCKICDSFPKTAKDYLTHLHSKDHAENVETMETPWHNTMTTDEYPSFEGAPIKRTPIRGLPFFVPATSWYCKICSVWMGDLHCASLHLKSRTHSNKYNAYLEKNPHYEVDWLAERQKQINEKKSAPPPAPIISTLSTTTDLEHKEVKNKSKHGEEKEKNSKKRKKKNSDKKDKKKKKRSKKRKKAATSSSSNDSSSETEAKNAKKKQLEPLPSSAPAAPAAPSIRVQMRNLQKEKEEMEIQGLAPPPPPKISEPSQSVVAEAESTKKDDLISQWNIVQSVISDSEKKLLEQLKGKLKNKPPEVETKKEDKVLVQPPPVVQFIKANEKKNSTEHRGHVRSPAKKDESRNDKEKDNGGAIANRRRSKSRPSRRSRSRSLSAPGRGRRMRRSRSRGGGIRRSRSRGRRSPSRGRFSPRGYGRRRRSRSQGRRRSRSHGRPRRRISSSRSRSRSGSNHRIEKAIVRQPEFRPRVPVTDANNVKKSKSKPVEEKEDRKKSSSKSSASNKKLPFIGRMPVFKKQSQNSENPEISENEKKEPEESNHPIEYGPTMAPVPMMQDSYAHAGYEPSLMSEYEDLMPDPVQFVSLMGAPPPPPSLPPPQQYVEEEKDILPPGIDETESEFVPKPISDAPIPRKGPLPKDFEEALNIIFPGEKKHDDDLAGAKSSGETQIIMDEPIMQQSDLLKEGIHMMTVEETSLVGMDEASQMSMNEPLQFNKPTSSVATTSANNSGENSVDKSPLQTDPIEEAVGVCISSIPPPPPPSMVMEQIVEKNSSETDLIQEKSPESVEMPTPPKDLQIKLSENKLDTNPQPVSPTDSEKNRRQEELDDLAMLGIDADDMAAMCI
ncbi:zinc finger matrin-type protein CG9776 [Episyrphus balteatus]|uniref:zinc finger matrin-type protein CG9776 n=1 Tax=Episyrphus balteatus TaxID=286459 RepID=UPI0024856890|nr:zinc finger matrin-type protein CG9776 [Episyrphus balteatus]